MAVNWDQSHRDDPAYNPSRREARALVAYEAAERKQREIDQFIARVARDAIETAARLNLGASAAPTGRTIEAEVAASFRDILLDIFPLPSPDAAYENEMNAGAYDGPEAADD